MIKGISDIEYSDAVKLLGRILDRMTEEEELLRNETEEMKIAILNHEYKKRLCEGRHAVIEHERAIEECNRRMRDIEDELFKLSDRKNYFEVQMEMLGARKEA